MPCRSEDEECQLPSDSDYATPPNDDWHKCWPESVPFSGEGSSSVPSLVQEIKFEKRGRAQEQTFQCVSHVTLILHCPALRNPFSGEGSNSIPSPVTQIQATQSKHIANGDKDTGKSLFSTPPFISSNGCT